MKNQEKREHREHKRVVKRAGHKHARNTIKRTLAENPEDAPFVEDDFDRHRSAEMNGIDHDATRRRDADAGAD